MIPRALLPCLSFAALGAVGGACARPAPAEATATEVRVVAHDYAFTLPDTLRAGRTQFRLATDGKQLHELVIVRLKPGVSLATAVDSLARGAAIKALRATGSGVLFAAPGAPPTDAVIEAELAPGDRWAFFCQFRDGPKAPKHQQLGMFKVLEVR